MKEWKVMKVFVNKLLSGQEVVKKWSRSGQEAPEILINYYLLVGSILKSRDVL